MFKNKKIKFYSSKIVNDQTIEDSYLKAVVSKKNELQVELEEEIKKIQQPIQQDIQDINEHIQQLNKRIRDYNSILEQLPTPEKVVSEIGLSKEENNIIEAPAVQTDIDKNSQEKSSTLLQSIREKKLKPLQPRNETGETNLAAINNVDDDPKKFAVDVNILSRVKLKKTVQTRDVISNNENRINPELAEKLTKQRALLDKSNPINIEHTEKSEEKFSNPAAVEVQVQKNIDNIAAPDQTQNADVDSFLLQQLKSARDQLINNQTTGQEDNLPSWVKSEFIASAEEKKLEEKKEQDFFNFSEIVCDRTDLSEEERQEIINFREQVCNVELKLGNEAEKKRFENTVSKIVEEITRPNSIFDDEFNNNLKTINEFIKEHDNQQQLLSQLFKRSTNHEPEIVEMILKPNFK
ncbi:hypothetical protein [Rickettsiella endosymbiont of Rhagonycha lignosa]|uniref:hypothetical protein n=1 Tax=Rickettsiella endosymbiont of Rhagonycha lignosa TaxID=3077937 RepID=UPI00313AD52A